MLVLTIGGIDLWNEETEKFSRAPEFTITFEHSLISLSKWETKHKIPFLVANNKTEDQVFDYFKMMVLQPTPSSPEIETTVDPETLTLESFTTEDLRKIQEYIDSTESATTFGSMPNRSGPSEVITSELIYYWMVAFTIPWEAQTWHLNRLFALIRICNIKNSSQKQKKVPKQELAQRYADLNAQRKAAMNTTS